MLDGVATLEGLRATQYNGCIALVLGPPAGDPGEERRPVFVFQHRKGIKVRDEHLQPAALEAAVEAACRSLAADDLALTIKELGAHRAFYEPNPEEPSIVMRSAPGVSFPAFREFLAPADYRAARAAGEAADCTNVTNVFRIAARLYGVQQLSHLYWFVDVDGCEEDELRRVSAISGGVAKMVWLPELRRGAEDFFRAERPFGLLVSHSAAFADLDHGRRGAEPVEGHFVTFLQVGHRFRLVQCFGLKPPPTLISLREWLEEVQPHWLDAAAALEEWRLWERTCTAPSASVAAEAASAFFRKPFTAKGAQGWRPEADISLMVLTDLDPLRYLGVLARMTEQMLAVAAAEAPARSRSPRGARKQGRA